MVHKLKILSEKMKGHKMNRIFISLIFTFLIATLIVPQNKNLNSAITRWSGTTVTSVKGEIIQIQNPIAQFKSNDGKIYELRLGPIWFWANNNYELKTGEKVEIKGAVKEDNGMFYMFPYTIKNKDKTIILADSAGMPLWSRGGKWGRRSS